MLNTSNENMSPADFAALLGNNNDGFGNGNSAWWIIILLLFANGGWGNNGWGGNGGGNGNGGGCMVPQYMMNFATSDQVTNGFNQMALTNGLTDLTGVVSNGFANAEISRANTLATITGQMNNIAMAQQAGMYQGQLQVANLGAQIAQEACADRQAVNDGVRDLMAQGVNNTQALLNQMNQGIQSIKDQMCQDQLNNKNEQIANLRQQLAMKDLEASQAAQNATFNNAVLNAQNSLLNELRSCPIPCQPVYGSQPIFTCNGNNGFSGCGCGN